MKHLVFLCHTTAPFGGNSLQQRGLGGVETTVVELTAALAAYGYKVTAITTAKETSHHAGVSWQPLEELPNIHADVFISCNDAGIFNRLNTETKRNARKIIWLHNPLQIEKAIRKKQFSALLRHRPDVVFVGNYLAARTSRLLPYKKRFVVGHGVSDPFLTLDAQPLTERLNRIVWVSQPQRGLEETLSAWRDQILPQVEGAEFHLFGIKEGVCGLTQDDCNALNITLHPRATKEQLAQFYNSAKLLLYPGARDETFCLAAAEAQCMGVPVVTKGIGSLSERVSHNHNGLIAKSQDAFAQAAIDVLTKHDTWQRLSTGALENREKLNWSAIAKQWQTLLEA